MTNLEYIKEMFLLQQKLNNETNGLDWEKGYTKNGKIINWKRCIYMECAELIDSFNWKHWKDLEKPIDWENAVIEIVDIWHFIISLVLEDGKINRGKGIDRMARDVTDVQGFDNFTKEPYSIKDAPSAEIINDIEKIIHETTGFNVDIYDSLLRNYFGLALKCGVNLKILYKYYIAKNVLNSFRQNHGYKEGSYKKMWNKKEDNVVMLEILDKKPLGTDELYKELEIAYKKLN
ncbi:MAG: dUTP diphosphatase [Campylobacteraceae bacterium]|nr:dUTP diphosphatase [Campylobacteraceae bacterium]